jgi:hypothetical protein
MPGRRQNDGSSGREAGPVQDEDAKPAKPSSTRSISSSVKSVEKDVLRDEKTQRQNGSVKLLAWLDFGRWCPGLCEAPLPEQA